MTTLMTHQDNNEMTRGEGGDPPTGDITGEQQI